MQIDVRELTFALYSARSCAMILLVAASTQAWIVVVIIGDDILEYTAEHRAVKF